MCPRPLDNVSRLLFFWFQERLTAATPKTPIGRKERLNNAVTGSRWGDTALWVAMWETAKCPLNIPNSESARGSYAPMFVSRNLTGQQLWSAGPTALHPSSALTAARWILCWSRKPSRKNSPCPMHADDAHVDTMKHSLHGAEAHSGKSHSLKRPFVYLGYRRASSSCSRSYPRCRGYYSD